MIDGSLGHDAMPEVEDMAWASSSLSQDPPGLTLDLLSWGEQEGGVEISLDGDAVPQPLPGLIQLDAPVQADHRAAGVPLELEERIGVRPEVDDRDLGIEPREEARHVRLNEPAVIGGAERPDPAIE